MPNHVHIVAVPSDEDGLRRTFRYVHRHYTDYINMYGPDADQLFAVVEPIPRATPLARGGFAIKRYVKPRMPMRPRLG